MDHVVVDVEIQKAIEETPGGWDATDKLGVAVACLWEERGRRMRVYGPDDVGALRERLLAADRISGYNIWNFDFPVVWGIAKPEWLKPGQKIAALRFKLKVKTNDLLGRIWKALGFDPDSDDYHSRPKAGGCKLDDIASATIGAKKIGNGADAPVWYQAGQVQRVVNYCCDDVCLERDLTDFVDRYGYVIVEGKRLLIPAWRIWGVRDG